MGTEPLQGALSALQSCLSKDKSVGGCCGEIVVKDWATTAPNRLKRLADRLCLQAQWFEYKLSHALYKPFEHCLGYISILPGAFSAYSWAALSADDYRVLKAYFKPFIAPQLLTWVESNVYFLAEDRIMSEEIVKIREKGYRLAFVKQAKATTEGAPGLIHLINQRRRWINGAWFSLIKVALMTDMTRCVRESGHGKVRTVLLALEIYYLQVLIAFTWVAVGAYYLAFSITLRKLLPFDSTSETPSPNAYLFYASKAIYLFLLLLTFIISLALNPKRGSWYWYSLLLFWLLFSLFLSLSILSFLITQSFESTYSMAALCASIGAVALALALYCEDWVYVVACFPFYVLMMPVYVNILSVYAICKTDDLTWGTRRTSSEFSPDTLSLHFARLKSLYLLIYLLLNVVFAGLFEALDRNGLSEYLEILYGVSFCVLLCPVLGSVAYCVSRAFSPRTDQVKLEENMKNLKKDLPEYGEDQTGLDRTGINGEAVF